jgi:hypothetical protein
LVAALSLALVAGAGLAAAPAAGRVDSDCADFATHWDAQAFFEANGGPAHDPHDLDADNDGIACEWSAW